MTSFSVSARNLDSLAIWSRTRIPRAPHSSRGARPILPPARLRTGPPWRRESCAQYLLGDPRVWPPSRAHISNRLWNRRRLHCGPRLRRTFRKSRNHWRGIKHFRGQTPVMLGDAAALRRDSLARRERFRLRPVRDRRGAGLLFRTRRCSKPINAVAPPRFSFSREPPSPLARVSQMAEAAADPTASRGTNRGTKKSATLETQIPPLFPPLFPLLLPRPLRLFLGSCATTPIDSPNGPPPGSRQGGGGPHWGTGSPSGAPARRAHLRLVPLGATD